MASPDTPRRESGWFTLRELADVLDISEQLARREIPRRLREEDIRREKPMLVHGRTAVEAYSHGYIVRVVRQSRSKKHREWLASFDG